MQPSFRDNLVNRLLPRVQMPGQYIGGEWNSIRKDWAEVRGKLCLAFPEPYAIGMSDYGLQAFYAIVNARADWACERAFAPLADFETLLREQGLPLVSLENFAPLREFDVVAFRLPLELSATNVLTMLDLGGILIAAEERSMNDPLVIASGPATANPESFARFFDAFAFGDEEAALPAVCDRWLDLRLAGRDRSAALAELAAALPFLYVPGRVPPHSRIVPAVVADLEAAPLPTSPIVPWIECVHERIAIEIARGCPVRAADAPVRIRGVETIVAAAQAAYHATGFREVALLGHSASDYPQIEELLARLRSVFRPLGVMVTIPNLQANARWPAVNELLDIDRGAGLAITLGAGREPLRRAVNMPISDDDLLAACRRAMEKGVFRVKLDFTCGLPGEGPADLDAIVDLAETISRLGKLVRGHPATVVANVANFIPRPHTPYERLPMQTREYFDEAHERLRRRKRMRSVAMSLGDVEATFIAAAISRGDRRVGQAIELAWRRGARLDGQSDRMRPWLWHESFAAAGVEVEKLLHLPCPANAALPWEHIGFGERCGHGAEI